MKKAISTINDESGAIIIIALMVLVIMTLIGVSATRMSSTESFIVRNVGIYKQNLHMVDSTIAEALETAVALTFNDPEQLQPAMTTENWVHDKSDWSAADTDWYASDSVGRILTSDNSAVPGSLINEDGTGIDTLLTIRGEWDGEPDNAVVRYALIGWNPTPGYSLTGTRRTGRLVAEYASERYGLMRMEAGVELDFEM